jgi:hypothetical protein
MPRGVKDSVEEEIRRRRGEGKEEGFKQYGAWRTSK